jgi:hypothetical protein
LTPLDRIRALHVQDGDHCTHCLTVNGIEEIERAPWPCPTMAILADAPPPPPPPWERPHRFLPDPRNNCAVCGGGRFDPVHPTWGSA